MLWGEHAELLKHSQYLSYLERRVLTNILNMIQVTKFEANEHVFLPGDERKEFMVVKSGEVKMEIEGSRGKQVYSVLPGETLVSLLYMFASLYDIF